MVGFEFQPSGPYVLSPTHLVPQRVNDLSHGNYGKEAGYWIIFHQTEAISI